MHTSSSLLRLVLLLGPLSACGGQEPDGALDLPKGVSFDPGTMLDARAVCEETCSVHDTNCVQDIVPTVYGLLGWTPGDAATDLHLANPNARKFYEAGCVRGPEEFALVLYCRECRSAYDGEHVLPVNSEGDTLDQLRR